MNANAHKLSALLRSARATPSLPSHFQQNVWQRIKDANASPQPESWLAALARGAAIFAGSRLVSQPVLAMCQSSAADDLAWLKKEYHLSDAAMAHIRELHRGYLPQCARFCTQIAAKNAELETVLAKGTNHTAEAQARLAELAALRARCQAQMLQHFVNVSRAMPPEQGRRYLAKMQPLTLGFHEEIKQSISPSAGHEQHEQ